MTLVIFYSHLTDEEGKKSLAKGPLPESGGYGL
jgi:hypothetical protein